MSNPEKSKRSWRESVKPPLLFSLVLGIVAFVVTLFAASGGSENRTRWDLALIGFGIAFIVSLVVCAMLMMIEKPNPSQLGEGSGVHRVSAKIPGGAANADNVPDSSAPTEEKNDGDAPPSRGGKP